MITWSTVITCVLLSSIAVQGNVLRGIEEPLSAKDALDILNKTALSCDAPDISDESLLAGNLNDTTLQQAKCAIGCLLKKFGVITENNEFDRKGFENFVTLLPVNWSSEEESDYNDSRWESCDVDEFEEQCAKLKAENECDLGWDFFQCIRRICEPKPNTDESEEAQAI